MLEIILGCLLLLLICLSAFFSMSEISFATCNKMRLKKAYEMDPKGCNKAYQISENFPNTISTILVGNNLVNIGASSISTVLGIKLFGDTLGPTIATIVTTLLIITFGEVLPKLIGSSKANKMIFILAKPLSIFVFVFKPIAYLVTKMVAFLSPLWTPKEVEPTVTDDELVSIVESIEDDGIIDEQKSDLIISAIKFSDTNAYDVMVPRVDVVAYDIEDDIEEFLEDKEVLKYSYIPVYEDSIDNILGVVSTKKIVKLSLQKKKIRIKELLEEPLFVHETKPINDVLKELHISGKHMAVVVDEFGGTDGILTSEDIIEELVGDIWDEQDQIVYEYEEVAEGKYVIDGDMNIYDMFDLLEVSDKDFDSEYSTVGGWVTEILEKFPEPGDKFEYKNISVEVIECDDMRVGKIQVEVHPVVEEEKE